MDQLTTSTREQRELDIQISSSRLAYDTVNPKGDHLAQASRLVGVEVRTGKGERTRPKSHSQTSSPSRAQQAFRGDVNNIHLVDGEIPRGKIVAGLRLRPNSA